MDEPPTVFAIERPALRASLPVLLALVDEASAHAGLAPDAAADLRLAVEEVCANVVEHGYPAGAPGPIAISIGVHVDRIEIVIADRAPTFDPSGAPIPDLTADWPQRSIGGLGWHLVRRLVDSVSHASPPEGGNRVTLTRRRQ